MLWGFTCLSMKRWRKAWMHLHNLSRWLLAFLWRTLMFRTTFILITGSLGKTTAKEIPDLLT